MVFAAESVRRRCITMYGYKKPFNKVREIGENIFDKAPETGGNPFNKVPEKRKHIVALMLFHAIKRMDCEDFGCRAAVMSVTYPI